MAEVNAVSNVQTTSVGCSNTQTTQQKEQDEIKIFDFNKDGKLNDMEQKAYDNFKQAKLEAKFDIDGNGKIGKAELAAIDAYKKAKEAEIKDEAYGKAKEAEIKVEAYEKIGAALSATMASFSPMIQSLRSHPCCHDHDNKTYASPEPPIILDPKELLVAD